MDLDEKKEILDRRHKDFQNLIGCIVINDLVEKYTGPRARYQKRMHSPVKKMVNNKKSALTKPTDLFINKRKQKQIAKSSTSTTVAKPVN